MFFMKVWTEEDEIRLLQYVLSGALNVDDISKLLGKTKSSVRHKLRAKNLRIINTDYEKREAVISDYSLDSSITQLMAKYSLNSKTVKNILMWGKEQGLITYNSSRWSPEDMIKLTRVATLLDETLVRKMLGRNIDIEGTIKKFWGLEIEVLIGLDINDFAELFIIREEDTFPIIETVHMIGKEPLRVVPWVFVELYEAKNPQLDAMVDKMALFQRMIYQEVNRDVLLEKIITIVDNKYSDADYSPVQ